MALIYNRLLRGMKCEEDKNALNRKGGKKRLPTNLPDHASLVLTSVRW